MNSRRQITSDSISNGSPVWAGRFTGNIGYHHIHHLAPKVANYHLEAAYRSDELFRQSPTLDIRQSLATIRLALYDETAQRMVSFKQAGF